MATHGVLQMKSTHTREEVRQALLRGIAEYGNQYRFACKLGVNSAHIYKALNTLWGSDELNRRLVIYGYLEPLPTRTRLAIDCTADTRQRFRDEAARRGMSGEAYLLYMMEVTR